MIPASLISQLNPNDDSLLLSLLFNLQNVLDQTTEWSALPALHLISAAVTGV